jgi:hypothetical protein
MPLKTALQLLGKALCQTVFRDANRFTVVFNCIFRDGLVFRFAEDETDIGLAIGTGQKVVNRGEVEIHFAGEFELERDRL